MYTCILFLSASVKQDALKIWPNLERVMKTEPAATTQFRVWIARYGQWQPGDCQDVPPRSVAVEPAEDGTLPEEQAAAYVQAFNQAAMRGAYKLWAIALPVTVRYDGDPRPGQMLRKMDLGKEAL
jgi:hypothetical protein